MARRGAFRIRRLLPFPASCFRQEVDVIFNYAEVQVVGNSKRICSSYSTVDNEGTVTTNGVSNDVPWGAERLPARGSYTMSVHSPPVFDALPTSSDVHDRLSITYLVLVLHCSVWNDVITVSDGGSNTLFEVDVRFLQILEYRVKLAGMNSSFETYLFS